MIAIAIRSALLMDLGFGGLIDKIEERFGSLTTNLLLCAFLFLIFSWSLETIVSLYVSGESLWEEGGKSSILGLGKLLLVHTFLIFTTFVVCIVVFRRFQNRSIRRIEQAKDEQIQRMKQTRDEAIKTINEKGSAVLAMIEQRRDGE